MNQQLVTFFPCSSLIFFIILSKVNNVFLLVIAIGENCSMLLFCSQHFEHVNVVLNTHSSWSRLELDLENLFNSSNLFSATILIFIFIVIVNLLLLDLMLLASLLFLDTIVHSLVYSCFRYKKYLLFNLGNCQRL